MEDNTEIMFLYTDRPSKGKKIREGRDCVYRLINEK
jgi:hypothetical protein